MSVLRGSGGIDLLEHAQAAGVLVLQAGFLGAAGGAEGAEERGGSGGVIGPDLAVAGVVGGLRAARSHTARPAACPRPGSRPAAGTAPWTARRTSSN